MDAAAARHIASQSAQGAIPLNADPSTFRPGSGWDFPSFTRFLQHARMSQAAPSTVMGGVNQDEGWRQDAASIINPVERFVPKAYDDPDPRNKGVRLVGYGMNLNVNKALVQTTLGLDESGFKSLFDGTRSITEPEAGKLRDAYLTVLNNTLNRQTKGYPWNDKQRGALLSIAYNMGPGNFAKTGIAEAAIRGDHKEAVSRILASGEGQLGAVKARRKLEAALFQGADPIK